MNMSVEAAEARPNAGDCAPRGRALILWVLRDPLRPPLLGLLRLYRLLISPLYGQVCRYYPSCSAYAQTAVRRHGSVRGVGLATWRLARCHPWAPGGVDHVPPARPARSGHRTTHRHRHPRLTDRQGV